MTDNIPAFVLDIHNKIKGANFETYLVGGCVRDMLLGENVKDWDFTTNATPDEILKLFPDGFYDNVFGTVGIPVEIGEEKQIVELTTFRTERGYKDRRHPEEIAWGKTVEEDLARRDFTINAMALKLVTNVIASEAKQSHDLSAGKAWIATSRNAGTRDDNERGFKLIDPYNGREDLAKKMIRSVGDPAVRFKEDALRLMRAVRLATQLAFSIEHATFEEIKKDAYLLHEISHERIRDELMKILTSGHPYEGIMLLKDAGLLQYILPELLDGIGVSQERPGRHHRSDVFTHNVESLKHCPSRDPIVRFATLIHDIGKPRVAAKDNEGLVIFHNHEIVGARIAAEICDRLRFSKKDRQRVVTLIRWHMFTVDEHITDSAIRRFIRRVGVNNVKDMLDLRIGDRLGGGTQTAESWRLKLFKKRVEEQLAPAPFSINDMAIDGNDIMKELGIKPGPKVGQILQQLFEEVDENLEMNTKEHLLNRAKGLA